MLDHDGPEPCDERAEIAALKTGRTAQVNHRHVLRDIRQIGTLPFCQGQHRLKTSTIEAGKTFDHDALSTAATEIPKDKEDASQLHRWAPRRDFCKRPQTNPAPQAWCINQKTGAASSNAGRRLITAALTATVSSKPK